jgi:hypothetical protein
VSGFIDHLYTRLGTTSNYSATINLRNSQLTTATTKPFPACCVFTSCSLVKASNSGDSSASRAQVLSSQPPVQNFFQLIESESYVTTDGQPASLSWNKAPIRGLRPDLYYMSDSYGLVLVGRPLWREVGSVLFMCCWPLPAQSFSGPSPLGLETIFYCLTFETSLFVASYGSQGHGGIRPHLHMEDSLSVCYLHYSYNLSANRVEITSSNSRGIAFVHCCAFYSSFPWISRQQLNLYCVYWNPSNPVL